MNKNIITIISLIFLIVTSCEDTENNDTPKIGTISIISPYDGNEFLYVGEPLEIIAVINNKEEASAAYISINNSIIGSGLSDTLISYYEPNSNINQNVLIEAILVNEENITIASDNITIPINTTNSNTLNSEIVFMDISNDFKIMRTPVTNRQFINFLNTNQNLDVQITDIIWSDSDSDGYGDPNQCEYDPNDVYEVQNWWYVNILSNYANENIPSDQYSIYKNGYNIYNTVNDYSQEAGKIRYDCETELFYLPNEEDGSESSYLNHPVVGVSWIGANIYADYFGLDLPTEDQWELAAKGDSSWVYPWSNGNIINENYANYNNNNTSPVSYYNGFEDLNLSLSAYGLYDMAGNVWEYTATTSDFSSDSYVKKGGAFNSTEELELEINYKAYALWEHTSYNTGFRCIADINYLSPLPSGCMDQNACNYDMFAQSASNCFENDCLNSCGGTAQEFEFYADLDADGLGDPENSELQCSEPQEGWVDNFNDQDDNCFSSDILQDNIDCNQTCDGTAYYDGCNQCVEGTTGVEPCPSDCNGDEGGTAVWDDCGVCSGGNSGHEANSDIDCNGDCFGMAEIDNCNICSGGNSGHEANSDIDDCGVCFGDGFQYYCNDSDNNGCCDCGNNSNGYWDECNQELDSDFLCETEVEQYHINAILGCSISNAENYYCEQQGNQCIELQPNVIIPPCNLIDDGSCIVYGCSDSIADNYDPIATICEDESQNNCCEYTSPIEVSFGTIDLENGTMEILVSIPEYENESDYLYGFQFNIEGISISSASGGLAEEAGFTVSTGSNLVLGFSFTGSYIGQNDGILTIVNFESDLNNACLNLDAGGSFTNEMSQSIPVLIGSCDGNCNNPEDCSDGCNCQELE